MTGRPLAPWMALLLGLALVAGCSPHRNQCQALCSKMVNTCGWPAWTSVDQCREGCQDDLYRRDDADELIACYHAAADPPSPEEAGARVDLGIEQGVYDAQIAQGTFDRDTAIASLTERMTCDPFAAVQCKTNAVLVRPDLPLVREDLVR